MEVRDAAQRSAERECALNPLSVGVCFSVNAVSPISLTLVSYDYIAVFVVLRIRSPIQFSS